MISQHSMQQIIGVDPLRIWSYSNWKWKDQHPEVIQKYKEKFLKELQVKTWYKKPNEKKDQIDYEI